MEDEPEKDEGNIPNSALEDLLKRLADLEEAMKNKVDIQDFRNELASLREMIGNIEAEEKPQIEVKASLPTHEKERDFNSKEIAKLKEII